MIGNPSRVDLWGPPGNLGQPRLARYMVKFPKVKLDSKTELAAVKTSPWLVGIVCRHLPDDMAHRPYFGGVFRLPKADIERGEIVFWGTGIIYECDDHHHHPVNDYFSSIIICPACLFFRSDGLPPSDIQVDVYLSDAQICQGRVIACDFHYNLAAVQIHTPFQLQTATLSHLGDVVPINNSPTHSTTFDISPLICVSRTMRHPLLTFCGPTRFYDSDLTVGSALFSPTDTSSDQLDYSELCYVKNNSHFENKGGVFINYLGQVIGLMFYNSCFLPINLVSIWWNNFKTHRLYHRPYLGVKIANLHSSSSTFLRELLAAFPGVTGGAVVTQVAEDSPAYSSGICPEDVIVKCAGKLVRSSLELFEIVWNKVGVESVKLEVLRASKGEIKNIILKVEQTPPDKMYQWKPQSWSRLRVAEPSILLND